MMRDLAKIVDAMTMIGMIVGNDHPVDIDNLGRQQLLTQIRSAVDEQPLALALDED